MYLSDFQNHSNIKNLFDNFRETTVDISEQIKPTSSFRVTSDYEDIGIDGSI